MMSPIFFCAKARFANYLLDNLYFPSTIRMFHQKIGEIITFVNIHNVSKTLFLQPPVAFRLLGDGWYGKMLSWFPVFEAIFLNFAIK